MRCATKLFLLIIPPLPLRTCPVGQAKFALCNGHVRRGGGLFDPRCPPGGGGIVVEKRHRRHIYIIQYSGELVKMRSVTNKTSLSLSLQIDIETYLYQAFLV
jgi:hypothetical protein